MSGPGNVDSWFEFIIWSAIAVAGLIGAIGSLLAVGHAKATRTQVENDHSSNLRDDVDRVDEKVQRVDGKVEQVDTKVDRLAGNFEAMSRTMERFMRESRAQMQRQDIIAAKHHPEDM